MEFDIRSQIHMPMYKIVNSAELNTYKLLDLTDINKRNPEYHINY